MILYQSEKYRVVCARLFDSIPVHPLIHSLPGYDDHKITLEVRDKDACGEEYWRKLATAATGQQQITPMEAILTIVHRCMEGHK